MPSPVRLIWATGGSIVINGALLVLLLVNVPQAPSPLREEALWVSLETTAEAPTEDMTTLPHPAQPTPPATSPPVAASSPPTPATAKAAALPQPSADALAQMTTKESKPASPPQPASHSDAMPTASPPATPTVPQQSPQQTVTASGGSKHAASYAARVRAHIESFKVYPLQARRRHQTGMVGLSFTINRQGRVLSAQVTKSSGNPVLDQAALDMLSAAQPLPRPPSDLPGESLQMTSLAEFGLTD